MEDVVKVHSSIIIVIISLL